MKPPDYVLLANEGRIARLKAAVLRLKQQRLASELDAQGLEHGLIAERLGCSKSKVAVLIKEHRMNTGAQ